MPSTENQRKDFHIIEAQRESKNKAREISRTWMWKNGLYHCGNCGRIPIFIDIREADMCQYCGMHKTFYEDKTGKLHDRWSEKEQAKWHQKYGIIPEKTAVKTSAIVRN